MGPTGVATNCHQSGGGEMMVCVAGELLPLQVFLDGLNLHKKNLKNETDVGN